LTRRLDADGWPTSTAAQPIPLDRFRDEVLDLYRPPLRARKTFDKVRLVLDLVEPLAGPGATTADLTPALVARFVASRPAGESPNTTISLLNSLRAACTYAKSQGYVRASPFDFRRQWVRPSKPEGPRHHTREEIARVLELLRADVDARRGWPRWRARRLYALTALVAYTGMRRNEALHLHAGDVDLDGRMVAIVERDGGRLKTSAAAQPVPMPEALAPILADWLAHRLDAPTTGPDVPDAAAARPVCPDCPWLFPGVTRKGPWTGGPAGDKPLDRLRAAGERAGVEGLTFLSLRHSFATHAEFWGLGPAILQRILRHTTARTQWHYRHADADNLRAAVRRIEFGEGPGAR